MKLWVDDVRPAPEGWTWARTNDEAKKWLAGGSVAECSLDHDMGLHDLVAADDTDPEYWDRVIDIAHALRGKHEETGLDLVNWMIENECVPGLVTIHSWNPAGASSMAARLAKAGHHGHVRPFKPPRR